MIESAKEMQKHLENTGLFKKVIAGKNTNEGYFVFECHYSELSSKDETKLRTTLEEYGPSVSKGETEDEERYLEVKIDEKLLIDNI